MSCMIIPPHLIMSHHFPYLCVDHVPACLLLQSLDHDLATFARMNARMSRHICEDIC